ncbi:YlqD family protein [Brevibacillus composti]|uniref:YlqD family protein n=1 Tax=Brevibacillus composti TaxID=2796470 RepID=A0A7T5EP24_9BACL|nr:YlqD family protein [Brevibacillus composti]QQE76092.1 YlqD family protein [Brevibacillus composti]QUO43121.1 YlqD family protein [Brevibacillus composti]
MLTILRTVKVKIILTEASRAAMKEQYERQLRAQQDEWDQWEFQARKLLADARKRQGDMTQQAQQKIAEEERRRQEKLENLRMQLRLLEQLPAGAEMDYMTLQSPVQIQVGDVWEEKMAETAILLKDGIVHEIRGG